MVPNIHALKKELQEIVDSFDSETNSCDANSDNCGDVFSAGNNYGEYWLAKKILSDYFVEGGDFEEVEHTLHETTQ